MKKTFIVIGTMAAISLASCVKENASSTPEAVSESQIIKAYVDNIDTKTTYNKNGSTYEFSWVTNDVISVMLIDGDSNRDRYEYKTTDNPAGASATFNPNGSLAAKWSPAEYAFYPANTNGFTYPNNTASPTITLGDNTVTQANPLAAIPMIGTNNGDGTFSFKAATGVLKITFTNLPAALVGQSLALELVTGQNGGTTALKGDCSFPGDYKTLAITANGSATKTVTMSSITDASSVTFYVPIPESTIAQRDMKIALASAAMSSAFSSYGYFFNNFLNPVAINVTRGVVTELPVIDYAAVAECFTYTGNPSAPKVSLAKGPRVNKVEYTVVNSVAAGITNFNNSENIIAVSSDGESAVAEPAATGSYYIVYRVLTNNDNVIRFGAIPFAYIGTNPSELTGTYKIATTDSNWSFDLAVSDNGSYDVMITTYNTNTETYNGITGKVYGTLNRSAGTLTFAKDQILSKSATNYYVCTAESISTGVVCTPDDNIVFQVNNEVGASNKLVFSCARKFGIVTNTYAGTGQQFNPGKYYQQ